MKDYRYFRNETAKICCVNSCTKLAFVWACSRSCFSGIEYDEGLVVVARFFVFFHITAFVYIAYRRHRRPPGLALSSWQNGTNCPRLSCVDVL